MLKQRVIVIGEKPTFLTNVIVKKIQNEGIDCEFVPWTVDEINRHWENTVLVLLYMDERSRPDEDIRHFLIDKMADTGNLLMPVGEKNDIAFLYDHMPGDLIYQSFCRPIDHGELVKAVSDLLKKHEKGEFKKSILVVDDDPGYLSLVREWLKGTYKVALVNSGLQAIKWLGKNKVDLILLDHEMPVTNGPQVLEMLRSDEETRSIPVMFLTGKSDKESVMSVIALKPEGYFLKTIEREELLKNLEEFFKKRAAR